MSVNIANIRREYTLNTLNKSHLTKQPIHLFKLWLKQAYLSKLPDPTAMCLATVDYLGQPYQRLVLLKKFTNKSMIFYTNLYSRKAIHLVNNSQVSLFFPWNIIDRQVLVIGNAYELSKKEAHKYFTTRPKKNKISTLVSQQSAIIPNKEFLKTKFFELQKKYFRKKIPTPHYWGGYQINIKSIEFWQGGINRLHDRFLYQKYKNKWYIDRLSP